ncbi:unnamed protein product, partial [Meganyctiphanes norvegica]
SSDGNNVFTSSPLFAPSNNIVKFSMSCSVEIKFILYSSHLSFASNGCIAFFNPTSCRRYLFNTSSCDFKINSFNSCVLTRGSLCSLHFFSKIFLYSYHSLDCSYERLRNFIDF